jgi:probable lipoprotein (TIGR04455 family)
MNVRSLSFLIAVAAASLAAGCIVSNTYLKAGYADAERSRYKRIALFAEADPALDPNVAVLYLGMLRDFLAHHREFIIVGGGVRPAAGPKPAVCAERFSGVGPDAALQIALPEAKHTRGESVRLRAVATLFSCADGERLWSAEGEGEWDVRDDALAGATRAYSGRYGEAAGEFTPAFWRMTRALYDSLPGPELSGDDIDQKIDFDAQPMFRRASP